MKYYTTAYRDSFQVMENALESWERVSNPHKADVIFIDREPTGNENKWNQIDELAKQKPVFIYPHTPYSSWLWDGYTKPSKNIACNFVCNEAAIKIMESYGYPCRVENVGFTRPLEVKPFEPTKGLFLAYAAPRLLGAEGRFYRPDDRIYVEGTMEWIIKNRHYFYDVRVFYSFSLANFGLEKYDKYPCVKFVNVAKDSIQTKNLGTQTALKQLEGIDIFIGSNTLGYIAFSQGIPTILVGHNNDIPGHSTNNGLHYNEYAKYCDFPFRLEDLTGEDLLDFAHEEPREITEWKRLNIGTSFDKEKFLKVVREYI